MTSSAIHSHALEISRLYFILRNY